MIIISHRGNLCGPSSKENHPDQIRKAFSLGFDVEIDVWYISDKFYLGHDYPEHEVSKDFFTNSHFWCHAKNIPALEQLKNLKAHYFWHQNDDLTLTSNKYLWTYPGKQLTSNSICVLPEKTNQEDMKIAFGICTDFPTLYKQILAQ